MAGGVASLEPRSETIGDVFVKSHPLSVPRYQRAYAWTEDEVEEFVSDVNALISENTGEGSHFFGGLVTIEKTDHTLSHPHSHQIVDGQQRLATLYLTLAAIARVADALAAEADTTADSVGAASARTLAADTRDRFLMWRDSNVKTGTTSERPRLLLSLADNDYFHLVAEGTTNKPTRYSHTLIREADKMIVAQLIAPFVADAALPVSDRAQRLDQLRQKLLNQCHVIQIVSRDQDKAYQIFSILNDRGRELADAELLRSYTLEILQKYPKQQEEAAQLWDEILAATTNEVRDFFLAYYPSVEGTRITVPLFDKFRKIFFPAAPKKVAEAKLVVQQVRTFADELEMYKQLADGVWPYEATDSSTTPGTTAWARDRLDRLVNVLKHKLCLPLLLAAVQSGTEKDLAELVYMLEVFAFRYRNVCGGHVTGPSKVYYEHAKTAREAFAAGKPVNWKELRKALQKFIDESANDKQFKADLEDRLQYQHSTQRGHIRELLTTIEEHRTWLSRGGKGKPKPSMEFVGDLRQSSLEHIYPQNAAKAHRDIQLEPVKQHLGNLTFFGPSENNDAANKPFAAKREHYYKHSRVQMTSDLSDLPDWTEKEFQERQTRLLAEACEVFRLQ